MKWTLKLLLLAAGLTLSSCLQPPEDEKDTPSTALQVQTAIAQAWGQSDPLTMTVGDFLFQETEQRLDSVIEPFYVLQEGVTIARKEEAQESYVYTYLYQTKEYKQGQGGPVSTREQQRHVMKPDSDSAGIFQIQALQNLLRSDVQTFAEDLEMSLGYERILGLFNACEKTEALDQYCREELGLDRCDIQCSNLKVTRQGQDVPEDIKRQDNCGNFQNCQFQTNTISFDWTVSLVKGNSVEKQRVNYSASMSQDLPFFARLTKYCFKQLYSVQNQKLLVSTCTNLKNFEPAP